MMSSYREFSQEDLERSFKLVNEAYPHIVKLVREANQLLPTPYYHLNAWKNGESVYVELLYGDPTTSDSLQVLNLSLSQIEATLVGFIHGFNIGNQSSSIYWQNFIERLKEVDGVLEPTNFIGAITRYRKVFMDANK